MSNDVYVVYVHVYVECFFHMNDSCFFHALLDVTTAFSVPLQKKQYNDEDSGDGDFTDVVDNDANNNNF